MVLWTPLLLQASHYRPVAGALDGSCAPGGNFDMSNWNLQLPIGHPDIVVVKSKQLLGCQGYSDSEYFFTNETSGAMVFHTPGNPELTGCSRSHGSRHCRTELRQVDRRNGGNLEWDSKGRNVLEVTMAVMEADDGTYGTAIGQVFAFHRPLAALYCSRKGVITMDIKPRPGKPKQMVAVGKLPLGTAFTFRLSYSNNVLSTALNGENVPFSFPPWPAQNCTFKLGNYNQGKSGDASTVNVYDIRLQQED
ncbi:hypothetical protein XA68_15214 [Ophiocordyceps unilateralis]|uniref:Alginate lyase 2 domain-containing protein n=1 Tax=Ophiocordyceps unilateralis TaxID=268505 RepID=A0A2A9P7M9_OPHUN|nr:hypothetical protein XA68_15214 [Ophiocordyceps unilateralis]